jgi:hypothetical protein
MNERFRLGKVGRLEITAGRSAAAGFLLLWALFMAVGLRLFRLRPGAAFGGGLLAAGLHFLSELWHQTGHARAAERTGYPMDGVHFWGVLSTSVYPADEPPLTAEIHVERALGGPRASAVAALLSTALAVAAWPSGGVAAMLTVLLALENVLVFSLGALLPLPFPFLETDGVILRRYLHNHRRHMVTVQE